MTTFEPRVHGFNFANTFNNDVVSGLDIRTGGLCGGMVYTSLDYFYSAAYPVPRQDFRPANRTPLQSYIYGRQVDSLKPNLTKWAEIGFNPGGARDNEFFQWGLSSELRNLVTRIDAGQPAPLGLQGHNRGTHQVLAIGYETGRSAADLRIFLYDPNFPNEVVTMRPSMRSHLFIYDGKRSASGAPTHTWRTYFVDKSYHAKAPLRILTPKFRNDGWVRELAIQFDTGDDDLRGGNDHVSLIVHLKDGSRLAHHNISLGARWLSNYSETAQVRLARPIARDAIRSFEFQTSFRGGLSGDNWDARCIRVWNNLGTSRIRLTERTAFTRFTGSRRNVEVAMPGSSPDGPPSDRSSRGKVSHLRLSLRTGGDDLRGNNDNVHATVIFRNGRSQTIPTINARQKWGNNSTHVVTLALAQPVDRADLAAVRLDTTSRGGLGGDNWNLDQITVTPVIDGIDQPALVTRSGRPLKRFTGDSRTLIVRW